MFLRFIKQSPKRGRIRSYTFEPGSTHTGDGDWGDCTRCGLCHTRRRVAIQRYGGVGHVKILFIGEAPGEGEDKTGVPFIGRAGKIFHQLIKHIHMQFEYCVTNAIGCRPVSFIGLDSEVNIENFKELEYGTDYELHDWNREPTQAELRACRPHIDELIDHYQPDGIVYLGKVAASYQTTLPRIKINHPAYIARLEYKLITLLKDAKLVDDFIHKLYEDNYVERP